jgi:hypothetical protein
MLVLNPGLHPGLSYYGLSGLLGLRWLRNLHGFRRPIGLGDCVVFVSAHQVDNERVAFEAKTVSNRALNG